MLMHHVVTTLLIKPPIIWTKGSQQKENMPTFFLSLSVYVTGRLQNPPSYPCVIAVVQPVQCCVLLIIFSHIFFCAFTHSANLIVYLIHDLFGMVCSQPPGVLLQTHVLSQQAGTSPDRVTVAR
jgi:hypothetical protein